MGPALQNTVLPAGGQGRPPLQNPIGKRCVGGRRLPTVVPTDSRSLSCPPIGALPRNRLASSATGSASPISPTARTGLIPHSLQCVIARARAAPVAIRTQSLPCLKGGGPAAGWWRDLCGEESPSHGFAVLRQGDYQSLRRFAHLPLHRGGFLFPCSAYPRQFAKG